MKRVIVIGGGISGLATAYYIRDFSRASRDELEITVIEKEDAPGGKMKSFHEEGFIVEWGPNGFLTNKPETLDLCKEIELSRNLYRSSDAARERFVFTGGKLKKLPESAGEFFASSILSVGGRLRVAMEPFIPGKKDGGDESLMEFASRRLGPEAAEKLIEPMAAGIYAGNPDEMSLKSCFPLIHELESRYGSLVKGMAARMKERRGNKDDTGGGPAGPGGVLMSFDDGVATIIWKLIGTESFDFMPGREVSGVENAGEDGFRVSWREKRGSFNMEADSLVISTPAYGAASLLAGMDEKLARYLSQIPYAPVSVVAVGIEVGGLEDRLNSFGFLVPRGEKRRVLGILFDSSIFINRAPAGHALLRGMIGGARNPDLVAFSDEELIAMMRGEMEDILGIKSDPVYIKVFRHDKGIPQYMRGHPQLLEEIGERVSLRAGLFLNSNAYRGIGLNDCVRNSIETARKVVSYLSEGTDNLK